MHERVDRESANRLGAYLRARRALITPEKAGIANIGVRRVPGLRREEVATLAGISLDYYLRLERGRDRNPSGQVLDSLARVLQLNDEHRAHLHSLVIEVPHAPAFRSGREAPPPGAVKLLHALGLPAFIENRFFGVIASNSDARAISPRLVAGANQLRDLLLNPEEQALYPDWQGMTECLVANLRQTVGNDVEDPRFIDLVTELLHVSPRFEDLWNRHDVRSQRGGAVHLEHPQVGRLTLNRERLAINGAHDMLLVVYHAEEGSRDAEKLGLLTSANLSSHAA